MSETSVIDIADQLVGSEVDIERLDALHDYQRLMGQILAIKALLELVVNASDPKTRRQAASDLLRHVDESPDQIAERIRASAFAHLDIETLEAMVQTGETDPQRALEKTRE